MDASIQPAQQAALDLLLAQVIGKNPFYTQKLEGIQSTQLHDLPFTLKSEWVNDQLDHPPYGTNLTYPLEQYTRFCRTSGTTGVPMHWLDTNESWDWMLDNWQAVYHASDVRAGDRIFFAFSFGPFLGFWTAFGAATRMGCMAIPGGGLSTQARLQMMIQHKVAALCCTPTYALHLAQIAKAEGLDIINSPLRAILVAGEPGGNIPAVRAAIEAGLGAKVYDHHGMTEVGPVTIPADGGLRVLDDAYIAEVIDPDTCEPASQGELVLTTLGRIGSPLIRYRTGDLVERTPDGLFKGGILSRADDMVIIRGVNMYPRAVESLIRDVGHVAEFRVRVKTSESMARLEIDVEPDTNAPKDLCAQIEQACRSAFSMRIPVQAVPANSLPRFELKAKRWVHE